MAKSPRQALFAPVGGMNQDDSIITPTIGYAGKNTFLQGDYKYLRNARAHNNDSDNVGDVEVLRSTSAITKYLGLVSLFDNEYFDDTLNPWKQLDEDPDYLVWSHNANGARITAVPDEGPVQILGDPPEFVNKGTAASADGSSCSPEYPSGVLSGDLLFLFAMSYDPAIGTPPDGAFSSPSGWTSLGASFYKNLSGDNVGSGCLFYKVADGSESGPVSVSRSSASTGDGTITCAQIYQFRSDDPIIIESTSLKDDGDGVNTTIWNAVTVAGQRRTLISFIGNSYAVNAGNPPGYTQEATDRLSESNLDFLLDCCVRMDVDSDGQVSSINGSSSGWVTYHSSIYSSTSGTGPVLTPFTSEVIYQNVSSPIIISGKSIRVPIHIIASANVASADVKLVFMDGDVILSEESIFSGDLLNFIFSDVVSIPENCDGIGIRVSGEVIESTTIDIKYIRPKVLAETTKPSGTERVVGKYENKELNKLFYAVYNSNGDHCIRYYDPYEDAVVELLKWEGLNFSNSTFVKMAMIDEWLCLANRDNAPRLINVGSISDLVIILGEEFREYHISFHKWAPVMPPVVTAMYDGAVNNYENFENKTFQWSHRYIYKGRLKSRWSPISKAVDRFPVGSGNEITNMVIQIPGFSLDVPNDNVSYNYFGNNDDKFIQAVEYIEIAYREGIIQPWKLFKRHKVNTNDNTSFLFDGKKSNGTPIPVDDFFQLFDTVPIRAGTVEAIDNRFVFADILDEQEPSNPIEVEDVTVYKYNAQQTLDNYWLSGNNDPSYNAGLFSGMSAADADILGNRNRINRLTFKGRGIYRLAIQWIGENGRRGLANTSDDFVFEIPEETGSIDQIYALGFKIPSSVTPPEWAVAYQIMRTNCLNIDYFMFGLSNEFTPLIDDTQETDVASLKDVIRDRLRQHFENARLVAGRSTEALMPLLRNKPILRSLYSEIRKTKQATIDKASRIYINVNNWYNSSKKVSDGSENNPVNELYYNFREGDRVRFIGSPEANPNDNDKIVYDEEILEFTGRGIIVKRPSGLAWVPSDDAYGDSKDFIIEVYTPKTPSESDYIYHETGEWYPVLYPGTESRDLAKRDWTFNKTSGITCTTHGDIKVFHNQPLSNGDCHAVSRSQYYDIKTSTSIGISFTSTSMNPNDEKTYDLWETAIGRSAPAYTDVPVSIFRPTTYRFGGKIIEDSLVNNINRFRDEDQKTFPSEYGRVRDLVATANPQLESAGAVLLAIAENETYSIYVNRSTLEDLSGRTQVLESDRVLGSYNVLLGSMGTRNPESVSFHGGNVYYWNATNGEWVRYGRDGLTTISKYKMRTWFRDISRLLITHYQSNEVPWIISEFDSTHHETLTFINHSSLPGSFRDYQSYKGIAFNEDINRWVYAHDYTPEMFGRLNTEMFSFVSGDIHRHEASESYRSFYGQSKDVMIEPVFNELPKDVKSWQTLTVISSHKWSAERIISEYRGSKSKQLSYLSLDDFSEQEDGYYAAIKKDVNTLPVVNLPIISGNIMRSKAIQVLLKLDPSVTTLSLLHYVLAGEIDSPRNS